MKYFLLCRYIINNTIIFLFTNTYKLKHYPGKRDEDDCWKSWIEISVPVYTLISSNHKRALARDKLSSWTMYIQLKLCPEGIVTNQ